VRLTVDSVPARLRTEWRTGHGTVSERELLLVTLESSDGRVGHGEAAPLESYDGASVATVRGVLEECREVLRDADRSPRADVLARCAEVAVLPQALAALDLALWDLEGQRAGQPVWRLLGVCGEPAPVTVNWTLGAADRAGAASEAAEARMAGFGTVKAKVGIGDDAGRLAAVRAAAGPQMAIRIDANGAWSPDEARTNLRVLAPVGIELCEEPVSGVEAIRELGAATEIPLALDESGAEPGALDTRACDLVCLKIARCGGLTGLLAAAERARAAGYDVFLASTLDGPLAIAAALHAAAALAPARACGLATLRMYQGRPDPLPARDGAIAVPSGPGLGDGLLDWYASV
jgi:L-alanine-DL-glutamate epimerase-like enolase superfamily enzyme